MNTISNRMNKNTAFVLFFLYPDSILLFPARTNLIYMMAFILFRAGFLTAARSLLSSMSSDRLEKTEKAMDDYVSRKNRTGTTMVRRFPRAWTVYNER